MKNMDKKVIEYIKMLGIDQINAAGSGHPGIVLGAAPIIYSVYAKHLRIDKEFKGMNRDRFVMSAGHGSALLYATLYTCGLLEMEDLKNFRRINSRTPGHPEYGHVPYVEATTGPLGQGIGNAVGMALASKIRGFDSNVYVLCGDGDLMEGVSYESLSFAAHMGLDNLIVLYDSNNISLDGNLENSFSENVIDRFKAIGFNTFFVKDSNDIDAINSKIDKAKKGNKPAMIEIKSVIGEGTSVEGTSTAHGKPLTDEDIQKLRLEFNIESSFFEDAELRKFMSDQLSSRMIEPILVEEEITEIDFTDILSSGEVRTMNNKVMEKISPLYKNLIGGSADLGSSVKTNIGTSIMNKTDYSAKNIYYGVREHGMAAITNGLALSGFRPYASTFLSFSDYMKPSIRLAAIMNIPSIFIFSHDSINIGSDGPTHQPIEQLAMLRSIPNLNVIRPCDVNELIGAWQVILNSKKPTALVVSREKTEMLNTKADSVKLGAYIVRNGDTGIIIATGSEVEVAVRVANEINEVRGISIRVVSMPSQNLFLEQSSEYRNMILPVEMKRIVIEAGSSSMWHRFVYSERYLITLDTFGASGTKEEVLDYMNFSYDKIKERVNKLF